MNRDTSGEHDNATTALDEPATERSTSLSSRRSVLLGVGGAGAVALLAACGSNSSSASGGSPSASGAPDAGSTSGGPNASASPSGEPNGSGSPSGGSTPGTGSGANDLVATSAIPVGGGKIFDDKLVVVTQPTAGSFKAFTAVCTHQGCTVSRISNGLIMCPCHGSEYSITDGSVKRGPAPRPLAAKKITVANGGITLG